MLNEGSVCTTWTYKTAKKLKHIPLINSTTDSTIGKFSLIPGSINNNEITCLDVAISTDDSTLLVCLFVCLFVCILCCLFYFAMQRIIVVVYV